MQARSPIKPKSKENLYGKKQERNYLSFRFQPKTHANPKLIDGEGQTREIPRRRNWDKLPKRPRAGRDETKPPSLTWNAAGKRNERRRRHAGPKAPPRCLRLRRAPRPRAPALPRWLGVWLAGVAGLAGRIAGAAAATRPDRGRPDPLRVRASREEGLPYAPAARAVLALFISV